MAKAHRGGRDGSSGRSLSSSASVARWERAEDIPMDEEDDFHSNRDKVFLDGLSDDDEESDIGGGQREVLSLAGSDLEDSADEDGQASDEEDENKEAPSSRKTHPYKRIERERLAQAALPLSDDEDVASSGSGEEDIARWGSNKRAYYNTNDLGEIDSDSEIDEEEARRLELEEVKKLQAKTRRGMEDTDFGLGEADELGGAEEGGKGLKERERRRADLDGSPSGTSSKLASASHHLEEPILQTLPSDPLARASLLVRLQKTSPETIALAGEYADVVDYMLRIKAALPAFEQAHPGHDGMGMIHLHYQALATYVTSLTFYFHLRASPRYTSQPSLLSRHPILNRILKLKEGLTNMEDLGFALPTVSDGDQDAESEDEEEEVEDDLEALWAGHSGRKPKNFFIPDEGAEDDEEDEDLGELDEDELAQLRADAKAAKRKIKAGAPKSGDSNASKSNKGNASNGAARPRDISKESRKEKKERKKNERKDDAVEPPLRGLNLHLSEPLDLAPHTSKRKNAVPSYPLEHTSSNGESYGEATSLTSSELEDKANKKHSLRFYTGQMDAKEARRDAGAKERMGGDSDIPYRDRERSRLAVEQTKAAKQAQMSNGGSSRNDATLDDTEWGEGDSRDWRDVMGLPASQDAQKSGEGEGDDDDDDDDYHDLVAGSKKRAKLAKKDLYDSERDSSRIIDDASLDPITGHRSLTRQIATNRGLTPHRKQDRNLRVKKRKKFEKAQKKLSSTRAVYKGGQGSLQGGYSGESSGINSGVSKSRRFAN